MAAVDRVVVVVGSCLWCLAGVRERSLVWRMGRGSCSGDDDGTR